MKHFNQHTQLLNILANGDWHCSTEIEYMRDARKRLSELNQRGYVIEGKRCDQRCGIKHSSGLFMRRLVAVPPPSKYEVFSAYMQSI